MRNKVSKQQSGRSMVEMLGVLAIIGVLSVGGVWGIKKALTIHKTNQLFEDARLAGFVVVDGLFDTLPDDDEGLDMTGQFAQQTPYLFKVFAESDTTFEILTESVPYPVCEETKKRKVEWLEEIKANGVPNTCKKERDNQISFFFNTELNSQTSPDYCQTDADCGDCGKCQKSRTCKYGVSSNGKCYLCDSISKYLTNVDSNDCKRCTNAFSSTNNACISCDRVDSNQNVLKADCLRCSQRYWSGDYVDENSEGICSLCIGDVIENGTKCNWQCPSGHVGGRNLCWLCSEAGIVRSTTLASCRQCSEHFFSGQDEMSGDCRPCNSSTSSGVRKEDCLNCRTNGYNVYWSKNTANSFLGGCFICNGTVSEDGTQCIQQ